MDVNETRKREYFDNSVVSAVRRKALIVDDIEMNREMLIDMIGDKFEILQAGDGEETLHLLEENIDTLAVLLLDIVMPKLSGIQVLEKMREKGWIDMIPVLVISGERDPDVERTCFELGVSDFIQKPFNDVLVNMRIRNNIDRYQYKEELECTVKDQLDMLREQNRKLADTNERVIELIADIVEGRNLESGLHVRRVKGFTRIISEQIMTDYPQYEFNNSVVDKIVSASAMHDVGKIMIEDAVLLKPGKLTAEEFDRMKLHTIYGAETIEKGRGVWDDEYYQYCYDIARHHHEKWDGRGYPDNLKGDDIPICAQIVAVADCFDALTTERVYKKAFTVDTAYNMILGGECGAFSPLLMDCFTKVRPQMESFAERMKTKA